MSPPSCKNVKCLQPMCADPVTLPGKCCPSCSKSKCKFSGCVQYEPNNGVTWRPSPCKLCYCHEGEELCLMYSCIHPNNCHYGGVTKVGYKPDICCPRCNYSVPEQECRAVPYKEKYCSTYLNGNQCFGTAIEYKCDKIGYRKGGKKFRCVEERGKMHAFMGAKCDPIAYNTVTSCKAVEDPTLSHVEGCDYYVGRGV